MQKNATRCKHCLAWNKRAAAKPHSSRKKHAGLLPVSNLNKRKKWQDVHDDGSQRVWVRSL